MSSDIEEAPNEQVLYLTTVGRKTGRPREIEVWFVTFSGRFYLFAETGETANWVRNIRHDAKVKVRIGGRQIEAVARLLDPLTDRRLWDEVAAIAKRKYGWGDGLPVEITPLFAPRTRRS
jgi:deazaflavin-dependent oxidoreductase (nitroreductase family)